MPNVLRMPVNMDQKYTDLKAISKVLPGQSKTFPSTAPDMEVIEVGKASRLEISSLGQKASRPVGGR